MSSFQFDIDERPKPGQTTEDLVKLQHHFLDARKSNPHARPAATAVRVSPNSISTSDDTGDIQLSLSSQDQKPKSGGLETDKIELTQSCFTGCVVEKCVSHSQPITQLPISIPPAERKSKFKMERRKEEDLPKLNVYKPKQDTGADDVMRKIQKNYDLFDPFKTTPAVNRYSSAHTSGCDYDMEATVDRSVGEKIHLMLAGYSEGDILKARESLLRSMKTETKEILAKRRATAEATKAAETLSNRTRPEEIQQKNDLSGREPEIYKKFPHMDVLETEKLQWTKLAESKSQLPVNSSEQESSSVLSGEERSGRFGLDGKLITKELDSDSSTWDKALHHHGEEMDRPGYTIPELFTLGRSTFPHQRTFGFNVLAEIFHRAHDGEFDFTLDTSIFQACDELDFVYVLRCGADLQDLLSLNASLNCLSALLFPEHEELCLDIAFNWPDAEPFPWLVTNVKSIGVPSTSSSVDELTESDLKDFQHVKNDLLEFLIIRTDLIVRFNYILSERIDLLNESGVQGLLKVLIRIARHSPNAIMQSKNLLHNIQKHYMNPNWSKSEHRPPNMSGIPLALAVKLFRILASSSFENANKLYNEFYLFPSIMSYLAFNEWGNQQLVLHVEFLVLESSNLWEIFLSHGLGLHEYISFFPVMMTSFQSLLNRDILSSFDFTYAARLHALLGKALTVLSSINNPQIEYAAFRESIGFVSLFVVKMLAILGLNNSSVDEDLCQLAVMKGLECLTLAQRYERFPMVDEAIFKFIGSPVYKNISKHLTSHSFLLFHKHHSASDLQKEKDKYPKNISICNALLFGGFQTPILDKGSPFAFITCLLRYSRHMYETNDAFKKLLLNHDCKSYLSELGLSVFSPRMNYFLRFELYCVREILKLLAIPDSLLPLTTVLPHVQSGDERLAEELLGMLINSTGVQNPEALTKFYSKFLFITSSETLPYKFVQFNSKVVPRSWVLEPLNILYVSTMNGSKMKKNLATALNEILRNGIETTLGFIVFCLRNCESILISSATTIAALYTRITLVFMLENQLFLEPEIRSLLKEVLGLLILSKTWNKLKNKVIFSKYNRLEEFPATFSSFYGELLEAFGANSFGDEIFGAYVMLPLRPPEDTHIKSLFWNEQTVRFLRTTTEQSPVPLQEFISSNEQNKDLLQIYSNAISSNRVTAERNQFLYSIISYHLSAAAAQPSIINNDK